MYFIYHARSRRRIKEQQQRNAATKTATTDACDERTKSPSEADMFRERELERGDDLIGFMCNASLEICKDALFVFQNHFFVGHLKHGIWSFFKL